LWRKAQDSSIIQTHPFKNLIGQSIIKVLCIDPYEPQ
jgi:hypothetical protein